MPWKGEKDPYKIWISEIILQQTRVSQGLNYYLRFIHRFPTIQSLASSPEMEVMKLWEGLGYYSRCRNLIEASKDILFNHQGKFPDSYSQILSLKGIGTYTAAAIASFAFNLPYAVVDGNVQRVLSRYFEIETPIDTTEGKKLFSEKAQLLLDKKNPGIYNQAIMDFGATICKPTNPECSDCPLNTECKAFLSGKTALLPVKSKSIKIKRRYLNYLVITTGKKIYLQRRNHNDIWKGLYEPYLIESSKLLLENELKKSKELSSLFKNKTLKIQFVSAPLHQNLTHQHIAIRFFSITALQPLAQIGSAIPFSKKEALALPFPKIISTWLNAENKP